MRWKIILVNGGVVLVLSLLTFFLLRTSLQGVVANQGEQRRELARVLQAADAQLSLDALRVERWLDRQATTTTVVGVFAAGTASARSEAATSEANRLRDRAVADAEFAKMAPALVLFVDVDGMGLGRNGSELMRGDKVGAVYPELGHAIAAGQTASDLWVNPGRQEQMLAAYAPVKNAEGVTVGALVLGTPLNDERLKRTSELTSGRALALVVGHGNAPLAMAGGESAGFAAQPVIHSIEASRTGNLSYATSLVDGEIYAAAPLHGYSAAAVLVGSVPASRVASVDSLLWPVFAIGGLGLLLVCVGGAMLGNYISRPVAEIEEGLLLIMNGQQDLRFDLEHDEFGGLTSRINALLNTLLGVSEGEPAPEKEPAEK